MIGRDILSDKASGLAVLDVDTKNNGEAWLAEFECTHGFPATRVHATRSGGLHFIFKHRPGLNCSRDLIARGVDVRADGGAIVWWPQAGYRVLCEGPVAEWPTILHEAIAEGEERRGRRAAEAHARYEAGLMERRKDAPLSSAGYRRVPVPLYLKLNKLMPWDLNQRRVRGILSVVTEKEEGRNDALYSASRRLRELIADGVVTRAVAEELLLDAAHLSGYVAKDGVGDAMDTIHSGLGPEMESGASRRLQRPSLAALMSFSISAGVRYSGDRRSALEGRTGMTCPFTLHGSTSFRCAFIGKSPRVGVVTYAIMDINA
jgi:hypothetical protein